MNLILFTLIASLALFLIFEKRRLKKQMKDLYKRREVRERLITQMRSRRDI
jgi:hypothetical protein